MVYVIALTLVLCCLSIFVDLFAMLRCGVGASFFLLPFGSYCVCRVSIQCRSLLTIMAVTLPMFYTMFLFCSLALSFWWVF